jgi:hypothetical protein
MSAIWSSRASTGVRRRGWVAMVAAVGGVFLVALSMTGPVAVGAPHRAVLAVKRPVGTVGGLLGVTAVPHSADVWAVGANGGGLDNVRYFVARRAHGHWGRVKDPNLGGRYGSLSSVTAVSARNVWVAGARQQGHGSIQDLPAIWRWSGKKFVAAKLPKLFAGACTVSSISASSATNVWAVGSISLISTGSFVFLHYNGKRWSTVPFPELNDAAGVSVSTSSATNAWATDQTTLYHWNGKTWTSDGSAPAGAQLFGVATDSPKLAYAVGYNSTSFQLVIMRFNGTAWSDAQLTPSAKGKDELENVTMHGRSVWAAGVRLRGNGGHEVILHSNGGAWSIQQSLDKYVGINGISAQSSARAYAVGSVFDSHAGTQYTYVDAYNGHSWKGASTKV